MRVDAVISDILGLKDDDTIVVALGNWTQVRHMQTTDEEVAFRQHWDGEDEEWVLTDFIKPVIKPWPKVALEARRRGLVTPAIAWMGGVNEIPDDLLIQDVPIMVRTVDHSGWYNLRTMAQEICEGEA